MTSRKTSFRNILFTSAALMAVLPATAHAAPSLIGENATLTMRTERTQPAGKTTQIRFDDGSIVSFVGAARYTVTGDREISVEDGNVTVLSRSSDFTVRTPSGDVEVEGGAALTVGGGMLRSHVFSGTSRITVDGRTRRFTAGQAWQSAGGSVSRTIAAGAQAAPGVRDLRRGGPQAGALNGLPISLGEALAALGASSDIVAAGRSFDVASRGLTDQSLQALPADFETLLDFQNALAARLSSAQLFEGASPAILDAYLRYLAGGGRIAEFQSTYATLIGSYLTVLAEGGFPSDFTGLDPAAIQAYLDYLETVGSLSVLGEAQQALIVEYLAFLRAGGVPADFIFSSVTLDAATIDLYFGFLSDFVVFVRSGNDPADFDGLSSDLLTRYIQLLASAGQLNALFGAQADVLQAYADFLTGGGLPSDFDRLDEFGLSEALIAEYTATLESYLAFLFDGGFPADFGTSAADLATFIVQLEQAGALQEGLAAQRALLLEFAAFVNAGGAAQDYLGFFTLGLSEAAIAQYSVSITALLDLFANGGAIADFDGNVAEVVRFIQILEAAGSLDDQFTDARSVLLQFVAFLADGGSAGEFDGFLTLGLNEATVASYVASITFLLDFFADTGSLSGFDGDVADLVALINALETSGQLETALSAQRAVLLDFVAFVEGGGSTSDFTGFLTLGLSSDLAAQYADAIRAFLDFLIDGGTIATFEGDLDAVISNIEDLEASGQLQSLLPGVIEELRAFLTFLADGGAATDFTGFDDLQDTGGGGTGDGFVGGPDVTTVSAVNADAIAQAEFRGARGIGMYDFGEAFGASRLNPISFDLNPRANPSLDDNGLPIDNSYNASELELVAADAYGDVLLTRHTSNGSYRIGGNTNPTGGPFFLDTVFVSNPAALLPTSGQVIFDLESSLGVQVVGDYEGNVALDMALGLEFGAIPRAALNGILSADTDYIFSTGPDGLGSLDFQSTAMSPTGPFIFVAADFLSGTGMFCSEDANCSANLRLLPTSDFTRLGGSFLTRSSDPANSSANAVVSFLARDGFEIETLVPNVTGSGSIAAPFAFDRGILLRADGGGDNGRDSQYRVDPRANFGFDEEGALSVMFRGFSNAIERGDGVVADLAGDEYWQVGRWLGRIGPDIFGQNSGLGYAIVPVLESLPAQGRIDFNLLGATQPVYGNGATAPGTFTGQAALIIGSENLFGIDAMVTMPDATYAFASEGGLDAPSIRLFFRDEMLRGFGSGLPLTVTGDGAACPGGAEGCFAGIGVGIGAAEDTAYAGVTYLIGRFDQLTPFLSGTAVFGGDLPETSDGFQVDGIEREDQYVVYSSTVIGIDNRGPATVVYDEMTGAPLAYRWELNEFTQENERPEIGDATAEEAGSVGDIIGWARWAGGTTGGRYFDITNGLAIAENTGWHVVAGTPSFNRPTSGTVQYDLVGNTSPTIRDGSVAPGTLDTAKAAVAFGTIPRVGIELGVSIGGESYSMSTIGGVADPSQGVEVGQNDEFGDSDFRANALQGTLTASGGSLCSGSIENCNATIAGFLAGEGASHIGISYTFGNTDFNRQVDGAAVFEAQNSGSGSQTAANADAPPVQAAPQTDWARWSGELDKALVNAGGPESGRFVEDYVTGQMVRVPDWISYEHR